MDFDQLHGLGKGEDEDILIMDEFEGAAFFMGHNSGLRLDKAVKLRLYALYKQATEGKCDRPQPSLLEFVKRSKWQSWYDLGDMDELVAMREYLLLVDELCPDWRTAHVVDNDAENQSFNSAVDTTRHHDDDDELESSGFAPCQSRPVQVKQSKGDLLYYCRQGELDKVRELAGELSEEELGKTDSEGNGALHAAAGKGNVELVEFLIESCGMDVDVCNHEGWTALHFACLNEDRPVILSLIGRGADLYRPNQDGETPFSLIDDDEEGFKASLKAK